MMGRSKKTNSAFKVQITYGEIIRVIDQLHITEFQKPWKDKHSEYGLICKTLGRKNAPKNRLRIHGLLRYRKMERNQKEHSKKHKRVSSTAESRDINRVTKRNIISNNTSEDFVQKTEGVQTNTQNSKLLDNKSTSSTDDENETYKSEDNRDDDVSISSDETIMYDFESKLNTMSQVRKETNKTENGQRLTSERGFVLNSPISKETIETSFHTKIESPYFTRDFPKEGHFKISKTDWRLMTVSDKRRSLPRGQWHQSILNGVANINPYCTFMIKRHQKNKVSRKRKKNARLFFANLYCKFEDCTVTCLVEMFNMEDVNVKFQGSIVHNIHDKHSRPVSGTYRDEIKKELTGQKPYKVYLKKFNEIPDDVRLAGNMSNVGSEQVIRQISTEATKDDILDEDETKSLKMMAKEMKATSKNEHIQGFIQHISIFPTYVMYWTELGVRLWHDLAKDSVVFWDATGSIIKNRPDEKKFLYYELAVSNPVQGDETIPVAAMISTSHDTPQITYWLSKFRLHEKNLYGHANTAMPRQINSDRSLVFIQSALAVFNSENLSTFRTRAWNDLTQTAVKRDKKKTVPHGCLAHVMKQFKDLCRTCYRSNFEYGMFLMSLLVNVTNVTNATQTLKSVLYVLLSPRLTEKTQRAAVFVDTRIESLPSDSDLQLSDDQTDEFVDGYDDFNFINLNGDKSINPNRLTEEEYTLASATNEFSAWADTIKKEVLNEIKEENDELKPTNKRHSQELASKIVKNYMALFPIWSNILLENSNTDKNLQTQENIEVQTDKQQRTNAKVEQRFRVLKDISLSGKQISRLDTFSKELLEHTEAIQKKVTTKALKPKKPQLKKASKLIEEQWEKKSSSVITKTGKYQTRPHKPIKTVPATPQQKKKILKTDKIIEEDQSVKNRPPPPSYSGEETVENRARKLYMKDTNFKGVHENLANCPYLMDMYKTMAENILKPYSIDKFADLNPGLTNIGNSCWFNASVQVFKDTYFMKNINEHFVKDLSYKEDMRSVLEVFHKAAIGEEVNQQCLRRSLESLQSSYGLRKGSQNDAHEFITNVLYGMTDEKDNVHIKMVEATACIKCGTTNLKEELYTDIQLQVANATNGSSIQELLDVYFIDEEMEESLCCASFNSWRSLKVGYLPNDLSLCLLRYNLNKFDKLIKIRKPILVDTILDMGKYTEPKTDALFRLQGVILHHGSSPTSGHYTALKTDGMHEIEIDDSLVKLYNGYNRDKDSYVLMYERIPNVCNFHKQLQMSVLTILQTNGMIKNLDGIRYELGSSVRLVKLSESLQDIKVVNCKVKYSYEACKLLDESLRLKPSYNSQESIKQLTDDILQYMFSSNKTNFSQSFGFTFICTSHCNICDNDTKEQCHQTAIEFQRIMSRELTKVKISECPGCQNESLHTTMVLTDIGDTLVLANIREHLNIDAILRIISAIPVSCPAVLPSELKVRALLSDSNTVLVSDDKQFRMIDMKGNVELINNSVFEGLLESNQNPNRQSLLFVDISRSATDEIHSIRREKIDAHRFSYLSTALTDIEINVIDTFDAKLKTKHIELDDVEVLAFIRGQFSDKHIDAFFETVIRKKDFRDSVLFIPAAWYGAVLVSTNVDKIEKTETWFDKNLVIIPVNLSNFHWILVALEPTKGILYYLDPIDNEYSKQVVNRILKHLAFRHVLETGNIMATDWSLCLPISEGIFPTQSDDSSCGAYVCLYGKMLANSVKLMEEKLSALDIRRFILHEIIQCFLIPDNDDEFGLKTILFLPDLDTIVHSIVTGQILENNRHATFLADPVGLNIEKLTGFGTCYIHQEQYCAIEQHLLRRYFKSTRLPFKTPITQCTFRDAEQLNERLRENIQYAQWYVTDVLVKEVILEVLHKQMGIPKDEINRNCTRTEFSCYRTIKAEVQAVREAKLRSKQNH